MIKILITGFDAFGGLAVNPSQLIVEQLAAKGQDRDGWTLIAEALPTEFGAAERKMRELIRRHRPEIVIGLGLAASAEGIRLERVALNIDDASLPDNVGDLAQGRVIVSDEPAAYWSTLPIQKMLAALKARGIPAVISNHAGTYVCNHIMYVARDEIERLGVAARCGFVHVPMIAQAEGTADKARGMALGAMVEAIESCIEVVLESKSGRPVSRQA